MTNTNNALLEQQKQAAYHVLTKLGATEIIALESEQSIEQFRYEAMVQETNEVDFPAVKYEWRGMVALMLRIDVKTCAIGFTGPHASVAGDILYETAGRWEDGNGGFPRSMEGSTVMHLHNSYDVKFIVNSLADLYTNDGEQFKRALFQYSDYEYDAEIELGILESSQDDISFIVSIKDGMLLEEILASTQDQRYTHEVFGKFNVDAVKSGWMYVFEVSDENKVKWLQTSGWFIDFVDDYAVYSHRGDDGIDVNFKMVTSLGGKRARVAFASGAERASLIGAINTKFGDGTPVVVLLTGKEVAWFFDHARQAESTSSVPHDQWIFVRAGVTVHVKMTDYNVNWIKLDCINQTNRANLLQWFAQDQEATERNEMIAAFDRGELQPSTMPASEAIVKKAELEYQEMFEEQFPEEAVKTRINWPTALTAETFEKAEVPLKVVEDSVKIALKDIFGTETAKRDVVTKITKNGEFVRATLYKLTDERIRGMLPAKAFYTSHQYMDERHNMKFARQLLMTFYVNNGLLRTALDNSNQYILLIKQETDQELSYDKRAFVFIDNQVEHHGCLMNIFVFGSDSVPFLIDDEWQTIAYQLK